jgi:type II secretory pathway component PulJ
MRAGDAIRAGRTRIRTLARRARQIGRETAGLSLVETLVAAAIVAIISVMIVFAFYTMASVNKRATDITNDDEQLSSDIALNPDPEDGTTKKESSDETLALETDGGDIDIELPSTFNTYTTEDGRSFFTFEYRGTGSGS